MSLAGGVLTLVMLIRHRLAKAGHALEIPYGVAIAFGACWVTWRTVILTNLPDEKGRVCVNPSGGESVMDIKKLMLLIGALVIAAMTAVMAKNMFSGAGAPAAQAAVAPAGPEVLVATRALPVGTIIDAEALRYQPWPEGLVQPAYYIKGAGRRGEPRRPARHRRPQRDHRRPAGHPGRAGQARRARLPRRGAWPRHARRHGRAFRPPAASPASSSRATGSISCSPRKSPAAATAPPLRVSETILRNIRVLATDQRTTATDAEGKPEVAQRSRP